MLLSSLLMVPQPTIASPRDQHILGIEPEVWRLLHSLYHEHATSGMHAQQRSKT